VVRIASSDPRRAGIALCVVSACGFALMAIFAKQAYAEGVGVTSLLAARFGLAAAVFWAIVALRPTTPVRPPRRVVLSVLALGGVGYSVQAGFFFSALEHIDASLTSLLLYTFPALVCIGAIALGRERFEAWKAGVLVVASAGVALVLLGGGSGGLQATGVLLGLGAGITYSIYILVAEVVIGRIDAWLFSALVASGAAVTLTVTGVASGSLELGLGGAGWAWVVAIALACTVLPITTFLLGLARVGSSTASIVSTVEPLVTVSLAVLLLGETLGPAQVLGGALVIGAVIALQSRRAEQSVSVGLDVAPPSPRGPAPARTPARDAA
jgi:drug/metabolite transporter (DMT)-like permease